MDKNYSMDTPVTTIINDVREFLENTNDIVPRAERDAQEAPRIAPGTMVTARFPVMTDDGMGYEEFEALYLGHCGD
jgi:hypothetical protein